MNIILRPWAISDLDSLVKYANNINIAKNMTDRFPHPYTEEDGRAFIQLAADNPAHLFAIEVNGEAVGGIGIVPQTDIHKKNAEIGYWLAEEFWGRGIITKAIVEITNIAFNACNITRVFAGPFGTNKASQKVLQKAGFVLEATFEKALYKNGEYIDEMVYAVRR